jgi:hypothetical protein
MAAVASNDAEWINLVTPHALENLIKFNSMRIVCDELFKRLRRTLVETSLPRGKRVNNHTDLRLREYDRFQERNDLTGPKRCDDLCQNSVQLLMILSTLMGPFDRDHAATSCNCSRAKKNVKRDSYLKTIKALKNENGRHTAIIETAIF